MESEKQFDVIVWGATGFTGRLVAEYLFNHGNREDLRWAMAGRNLEKLEAIRDQIGDSDQSIPLLTADSSDEASLRELAKQTRVVLSMVGPFALYGSPLVKVCAETGTDYCDLTGEPQWIRRMIDTHEETAKQTGARIVHCCGFDSVPSDLGVMFLQQQARERFGKPLQDVSLYVRKMKGGASGGTAHSMANGMEESAADPEVARLVAHAYGLNPRPLKERPKQPDLRGAKFDADVNQWIAPFVMAIINTRIVQRSNALANYAYGEDFVYREVQCTGRGVTGQLRGVATSLMLAQLMLALRFGPTRALMKKFVLPKAGEGPEIDPENPGYYDILIKGKTRDGEKLAVTVKGDADPGYGSTSKMLSEAAICLALEVDKSAPEGGFWTPSTAMGSKLLNRLQENAGVTFSVAE